MQLLSPFVGRRSLVAWTTMVMFQQEPAPREALLSAIGKQDDRAVEGLLAEVIEMDPSKGKGAASDQLTGEWRLLWSAKTSKFSPLLSLPKPLRPESMQKVPEVPGRAANTLTSGVLGGATLELSSNVEVKDPKTLEIYPPFWLDLALGDQSWRLVDAESDATFRKTQARSLSEQRAPRNLYVQLYLETSGNPGDLRISKVVAGDPVIVGATFIHQRVV